MVVFIAMVEVVNLIISFWYLILCCRVRFKLSADTAQGLNEKTHLKLYLANSMNLHVTKKGAYVMSAFV
jgi:hypothetical protein